MEQRNELSTWDGLGTDWQSHFKEKVITPSNVDTKSVAAGLSSHGTIGI